MTKWNSVGQTKYSRMKLRKIRLVLIGILTCLLTLCCLSLSGCTQTKEVYVELPNEPILCIQSMNTPEEILLCLNEYAIKYKKPLE